MIQRSPIGGTAEVAWPRSPNLNHILLLISSCPGDGSKDQEELLRKISTDAPKDVLGDKLSEAEVNPAGLEPDYHSVKAVSVSSDSISPLMSVYLTTLIVGLP